MAAVTQANAFYNVVGKLRSQFYNITGGDGDTLIVGLNIVNGINSIGGTITGWTQANATPGPGQTTITFAASGPFTAQAIEVVGN